MHKRYAVLSGGIALYAIGMWLAWSDEQRSFGAAPSEFSNHEVTVAALVLTGLCVMLIDAILIGLKMTIGTRAAGGAGMMLLAFALPWLWDHGVDVLGPNVHGWSAGFILLPVRLLASGAAWLLLAVGGAMRRNRLP